MLYKFVSIVLISGALASCSTPHKDFKGEKDRCGSRGEWVVIKDSVDYQEYVVSSLDYSSRVLKYVDMSGEDDL